MGKQNVQAEKVYYTTAIATVCDWLKNLEPMAIESNYAIAIAIATICDC